MRHPVNEAQASTLAQLLASRPGAFTFDALGTPGQEGPVLVDYDAVGFVIDTDGVCCLLEPVAAGTREDTVAMTPGGIE